MEDEKKLQDRELNEVNGGNSIIYRVKCENCGTGFDFREQKSKKHSTGCSSITLYQCPGCQAWVDDTGAVYN